MFLCLAAFRLRLIVKLEPIKSNSHIKLILVTDSSIPVFVLPGGITF